MSSPRRWITRLNDLLFTPAPAGDGIPVIMGNMRRIAEIALTAGQERFSLDTSGCGPVPVYGETTLLFTCPESWSRDITAVIVAITRLTTNEPFVIGQQHQAAFSVSLPELLPPSVTAMNWIVRSYGANGVALDASFLHAPSPRHENVC
jgi:hypothetical protein